MTARVVIVGSLNMDLIIRSSRIPQPGETILGGEFHTAPGGKGANQAVAAARMGGRVAMVGRVGDDSFAATLLENLAAAGVDSHLVFQDSQVATGVALIVVDDKGENSIVVASGANMRLSPQDIEHAEDTIAESDVLILQMEVPVTVNLRAAEIAHANGVKVVLNPAPARQLPTDMLRLVDVLIPNETEASILTGLATRKRDGIEKSAQRLLESGVGSVVLTLGERGALFATTGESKLYPAYPVKVVDTTAAGDAFVGGFSVAWAEGKSLSEAIRWGNGAGALATTQLGAQPSLPTRQEVEALIGR